MSALSADLQTLDAQVDGSTVSYSRLIEIAAQNNLNLIEIGLLAMRLNVKITMECA